MDVADFTLKYLSRVMLVIMLIATAIIAAPLVVDVGTIAIVDARKISRLDPRLWPLGACSDVYLVKPSVGRGPRLVRELYAEGITLALPGVLFERERSDERRQASAPCIDAGGERNN